MSLDSLKITNEAGQPVRLSLYGRIGGSFWDDIDVDSVRNALAFIEPDRAIDITLNSEGGSVFTAMAIYSLLANHKGKITVTVAGLAASAATLITSVPNAKVIMPVGAMMLIHPVRMQVAAPQTAEELMDAASNLEKIRESMVDVYQTKTGMAREAIAALMSKESFLTASDAVVMGFADDMDFTQQVTNTFDGTVAVVNGLTVSNCIPQLAPEGFFKAEKSADKKGVQMDINTFRAEHPEIVDEIRREAVAEGVARERARIKAIEEIAVAGHEALVNDAKFVNGITAEALAVEILKAEREANGKRLEAHLKDAKELDGIKPEGNNGIDPKGEKNAENEAIIAAAKRGFERA